MRNYKKIKFDKPFKKFYADSYTCQIKEVDVLRETDCFVYVPDEDRGKKQYFKKTMDTGYFDEFKDAKNFLSAILDRYEEAATKELERINNLRLRLEVNEA
jgi:hypothetical protein